MSDIVLVSVDDGIAVMTLNRPAKLNALNYELIDALTTRLDVIETDENLRAVIVTGAGDRAFSAGADIAEFRESIRRGPAFAGRDFVRRGQAMTARLEAFPKPIIAAVNGLAFGGGCEIIEAVPLAVASERALFAKPEIALGMPPTFGGTQRLPRLVGRKRALELLLTGDPFSPTKAEEIGLVNAVVPHDDLMPAAMSLARRIIRHAAQSVGGILAAVTRGLNMSMAEGLLVEADQFARLAPTRALEDGLAAWLERRRLVPSSATWRDPRPSDEYHDDHRHPRADIRRP